MTQSSGTTAPMYLCFCLPDTLDSSLSQVSYQTLSLLSADEKSVPVVKVKTWLHTIPLKAMQ